MKIKALVNYYDKQLDKNIISGEEYEVNEERGKEIVEKGYAEAVKEAKKETKVEKNEEKEEIVEKKTQKSSKKTKK